MKTKLLLSAFFLFAFLISQGQWTYSTLSSPRDRQAVAVVGSKAYFAGGEDIHNNPVSTIEVYDVSLEDWDTTIHINLVVPRMHTTGVSCGDWILFAGGADLNSADMFSEVDIWNTVTHQYIIEELSVPRVFLSAVSNGQKVLFAGGTNLFVSYDVVDIYNVTDGTWSSPTTLSVPRSDMGEAVIGDMAFFAGGFIPETSTVTDVVDIYHFSTSTWTTATLSQARGFLASASVGSKVLFAGGTTADNQPSNRVDIYDTLTQTWDTASLSVPRAFIGPCGAVVYQDKVYFPSGGPMDIYNLQMYANTDVIDIYEADIGTWSFDTQTQSLMLYAAAGVEDYFILAGGWTSTGEYSSTVEIYCTMDGLTPQSASENSFRVYPNPTSGAIHLELPGKTVQNPLLANVYNMQGQMVFSQTLLNNDRELNLQLPAGVYVLRVVAEDKVYSELITIQ
jgi:hypothetical protein